jgi:D-lactate dehydrogenase (cytochrome)
MNAPLPGQVSPLPELSLRPMPAAMAAGAAARDFGEPRDSQACGHVRAAWARRVAIPGHAARSRGVLRESPPTWWPLWRLAAEHRVPVIPFGIGSSLEGHLLAVQGGISLDVSRMKPRAQGQRLKT